MSRENGGIHLHRALPDPAMNSRCLRIAALALKHVGAACDVDAGNIPTRSVTPSGAGASSMQNPDHEGVPEMKRRARIAVAGATGRLDHAVEALDAQGRTLEKWIGVEAR